MRLALGLQLLVALVILTLSGCGGGGQEEGVKASQGGQEEGVKDRPLPQDPQALRPGEYHSVRFEPSLSFRIGRFTDNERIDALGVQVALVPHTIACLGFPRLLGLAIDWTFLETTLPSGHRMRYQVLKIAVPRKGRALPLLQLAYDRDNLSPNKSQNQIEQDALLAVVRALPGSVRPVVLADRGFHRASFLAWLECHHLHYVVRIRKGSCITEKDGRRWKLGQEGLKIGEVRFIEGVRYGRVG